MDLVDKLKHVYFLLYYSQNILPIRYVATEINQYIKCYREFMLYLILKIIEFS